MGNAGLRLNKSRLATRLPLFVWCAVLLITLVPPLRAAGSELPPPCGMAVLASSIGTDYSPEDLATVVKERGFSPVIVDWAWITAHWDQTNFAALNKFLDLVVAQNVPVAAMYRPRFLDNPTVPIQTKKDGKPVVEHGAYICFSSSEARHWGAAWGSRILRKCPQISEIIIYNPLNQCECAACQKAGQGRPYANYDAVWKFLAEAKTTWQQGRAGVKLGVVFPSDPEFWKRGAQIVDLAHPFLFVNDETDVTQDAIAVGSLADVLPGLIGACLAKVTWGENDKVSPARLAEFDRIVSEAELPYFVWTYETLFNSELYDPNAVVQALKLKQGQRQGPEYRAPLATKPTAPPRLPMGHGERYYTPDQVRSMSTAEILDRMLRPEPDCAPNAPLEALVQKANRSTPDQRPAVISEIIAAMQDRSHSRDQRIQCAQALGAIADAQAVPALIRELPKTRDLNAYATESLMLIYKATGNAAARDALQKAAPTSAGAQEQLAKVGERSLDADGSEAPAGPNLTYLPDQIKSLPAEVFLRRMCKPGKWVSRRPQMEALVRKAKEDDPAARAKILKLVAAAMKDSSHPDEGRWLCCYVLSGSEDERAVPDLVEVLQDQSENVRACAAEALADFYEKQHSEAAHKALLQAARQDKSQSVQAVLTRRLGKETVATASAAEERAPNGPPQPPPGPAAPVSKPLPWPFPGGQEDQRIWNNYQQATDGYIHCGLDFMHPAGTPVKAVASGYVAVIATNYPQWKTHHFFIVTPEEGGNEGWCYTHLDPDTFTFGEGDFVKQGQLLGSLVDFSLGDLPGDSHLHLHYVRFSRDASGQVNVHSLLDPLYFFDWKDTVPPTIQPLIFVPENGTQPFPPDKEGTITVNGPVDILAAITDNGYPDHMGNLGVSVVMLSISDGKHTWQTLVLDHRGDVGDETRVKPLFLSRDQRKAFMNPDSFPRYQMLRVTKTDGDGLINARDREECWNTPARDAAGKKMWPDGLYSVNVYAWDIAGNRAVSGTVVRVRNRSAGIR